MRALDVSAQCDVSARATQLMSSEAMLKLSHHSRRARHSFLKIAATAKKCRGLAGLSVSFKLDPCLDEHNTCPPDEKNIRRINSLACIVSLQVPSDSSADKGCCKTEMLRLKSVQASTREAPAK